ncbi:hypothetical protein O3P69_011690, partial [Scylla paramamosain]
MAQDSHIAHHGQAPEWPGMELRKNREIAQRFLGSPHIGPAHFGKRHHRPAESWLGGFRENTNMFALHLRNTITREVNWLQNDLTMAQVECRYPNLRGEDTKLELRVRYILGDLPLLCSKDRHTFNFCEQ